MSSSFVISSGWGISEVQSAPQDAQFERALQLHRQGQLDEAETVYYDILDLNPFLPCPPLCRQRSVLRLAAVPTITLPTGV